MGGNNKGKPCKHKTGPYNTLKCPPKHQAHHIVPDFTQRYGTRTDSTSRVEGSISLNNGPCICLPGKSKKQGRKKIPSKHNIAHNHTDGAIKNKGTTERTINGKHYPKGTAPLYEILEISITGAATAVPECAENIRLATKEAFKDIDKTIPCRTTKSTPSKEAKQHLSNYTKTNNKTKFSGRGKK